MENDSKIPIAIAEDSQLFSNALVALLEQQGKTDILFTAENGEDLLEKLEKVQPKIISMDIKMPVMDGIEATRKVKELYPNIYVIILSNYHDLMTVQNTLKAGADGYLLKDIDTEELLMAYEKVSTGETYFCERVRNLITEFSKNPKDNTNNKVAGEVINLIAEGWSNEEIAAELFLSKNAVEKHWKNLLNKIIDEKHYIALDEQQLAAKSLQILENYEKEKLNKNEKVVHISFSRSDETIDIPMSVFLHLKTALSNLAKGKSANLLPTDSILSAQQASELLNVSRSYIGKLLEQGKIPFTKIGNHKKIKLDDLLAFKAEFKKTMRKNLDILSKEAQDLGLGYE